MADHVPELPLGDEQAGADPALDLIAWLPALYVAADVSTMENPHAITLVQHKVRRN